MNYAYTDELYHHGIKGQKWGVRRFRNKDGSLTSAGKARNAGSKTTKGATKKAVKDAKNSPEYKAARNANIKKAMIGAAVVGGVALAAYGGYKFSKSKKMFESYSSNGKAYMESANRNKALDHAYASLFEVSSRQYRLGQDDKGRMTEFATKSSEALKKRLEYENKSEDAYNKARGTAYYKLHTAKGKQKLDAKYSNPKEYGYSTSYKGPDDWSVTVNEFSSPAPTRKKRRGK